MFIIYCKINVLLFWIRSAMSMSVLGNSTILSISSNSESDLEDFIIAKGYIPNNKDLPKASVVKKADNDVTYLLSKMSDEELIKLLKEQPHKSEYSLKDLLNLSANTKHNVQYKPTSDLDPRGDFSNTNNQVDGFKKKRFQVTKGEAYFRLDDKEVDPFAQQKGESTQDSALQNLNNLLYSRPVETELDSKTDIDDEKKELLFDILVGQLKNLCCNKNKRLKTFDKSKQKLASFVNKLLPKQSLSNIDAPESRNKHRMASNEYMFLILNDEIKNNGNDDDELISVDPDSLGKKSSVMVLGPVTTTLSDSQLKIMMKRISNELAKPEYLPMLYQISNMVPSKDHLDSVFHGPQTRRYIKPHRCNHQSLMTRIYNGPKWLICTGYLNINTPSIYD